MKDDHQTSIRTHASQRKSHLCRRTHQDFGENGEEIQNRSISYVKVLWKYHKVAEATWELESEMHEKYPMLFLLGK